MARIPRRFDFRAAFLFARALRGGNGYLALGLIGVGTIGRTFPSRHFANGMLAVKHLARAGRTDGGNGALTAIGKRAPFLQPVFKAGIAIPADPDSRPFLPIGACGNEERLSPCFTVFPGVSRNRRESAKAN